MKIFFLYWLPLMAYMCLIFQFSSEPLRHPFPNFPNSDKIIHIIEYSFFGFLLARALVKRWPMFSRSKTLFLCLLGAGLYGISDEIHQSFTPGRDSSFGDIIADTIGGTAGGFFYLILLQLTKP